MFLFLVTNTAPTLTSCKSRTLTSPPASGNTCPWPEPPVHSSRMLRYELNSNITQIAHLFWNTTALHKHYENMKYSINFTEITRSDIQQKSPKIGVKNKASRNALERLRRQTFGFYCLGSLDEITSSARFYSGLRACNWVVSLLWPKLLEDDWGIEISISRLGIIGS